MAQVLQHVHFPPKELRRGGNLPSVGLQNHLLVQTEMVGKIHHASAAGTDLIDDLKSRSYDL